MDSNADLNKTVVEDAGKLQFGPEFENAQPLLIAEVKMILEAQTIDKPADKVLTEVFEKTLVHCRRFNRITRYDTVKEIRRILTDSILEPFEVAQIACLSVEFTDEAQALIPSLNIGIRADDLQEILTEATSVKKFQS